ncbi:DUF4079 domain-containing protein [Spirulina subsalsa]|uniref:DUF4079 domain-containing protein n=1 Tax=Spirulina subsalsa TaxID=54311 RepID=UPI0002DBB6F8|nr:DUF4079 domain-containing protein [Spirulina subsalsa]
MDLPSFLWLWKIAAWSMGLSVTLYVLLATTGFWFVRQRWMKKPRPGWLRPLHYTLGVILVLLVLVLLSIGIIGTLGYYGSLGHSPHLLAGIGVVGLVLFSAWTATRIGKWPQARSLHLTTNLFLLLGLVFVTLTGWDVVQKYLP